MFPAWKGNESASSELFAKYCVPDKSEGTTGGGGRLDSLPPGLNNIGNTCYMNSALQCLLRVKRLNRYLLSEDCSHHRNSGNPLGTRCIVLDAYCELVRTMQGSHSSVHPGAVKWAVGGHNRLFADYGQHDATEFLVTLLDALNEDLNRSDVALAAARGVPINVDHLSHMELHAKCNRSIITVLSHVSRVDCWNSGDDRSPLTSPEEVLQRIIHVARANMSTMNRSARYSPTSRDI
jgi:ubiquitin C-terminal hydrolase